MSSDTIAILGLGLGLGGLAAELVFRGGASIASPPGLAHELEQEQVAAAPLARWCVHRGRLLSQAPRGRVCDSVRR